MTQASTYADLLERVEKAEGPSEELDFEIWLALNPDDATVAKWSQALSTMTADEKLHWASRFTSVARYTASLNAAIALVEKVLPGWEWGVRNHDYEPIPRAYVNSGGPFGQTKHHSSRGPTPALALISALLRSLQQGGGQ